MVTSTFPDARAAIIAAGRWLDAKGWAPATAGNYSVRLVNGFAAITVSGRHKGRLTEEDVMQVDSAGRAFDGKRPSAETPLHLAIYRDFRDVGAVLHSHSPTAVGLTRAFPQAHTWTFTGHEMLKVLPGIATHATSIAVPIVDNSQDMAEIDAAVGPLLRTPGAPPCYLIRGHGLYGWGADMAAAERVIEGIEWLIAAELAEAQFRLGSGS